MTSNQKPKRKVGRPPKPPEEKTSRAYTVRLTPAQAALLLAEASKREQTAGMVARDLLLERLGISKT